MRDWYFGIDHWAIREWSAGNVAPPPIPDKTRSNRMKPIWSLAAAGVSRDITDDRSILPPKNHLPPKRSANQPAGIYSTTSAQTSRHNTCIACEVKIATTKRVTWSRDPRFWPCRAGSTSPPGCWTDWSFSSVIVFGIFEFLANCKIAGPVIPPFQTSIPFGLVELN